MLVWVIKGTHHWVFARMLDILVSFTNQNLPTNTQHQMVTQLPTSNYVFPLLTWSSCARSISFERITLRSANWYLDWFKFMGLSYALSISSGSSSQVGAGGKKHEIYVAAFGGHFLWLILQGQGGHDPLGPPAPESATEYCGTQFWKKLVAAPSSPWLFFSWTGRFTLSK